MTEKLCEELAFPVLFPKRRFGHTTEQQIKSNCYQLLDTLMPDCYITVEDLQRIQNISSLLISLSKRRKVSDNINIALKKVHGIIILSL